MIAPDLQEFVDAWAFCLDPRCRRDHRVLEGPSALFGEFLMYRIGHLYAMSTIALQEGRMTLAYPQSKELVEQFLARLKKNTDGEVSWADVRNIVRSELEIMLALLKEKK